LDTGGFRPTGVILEPGQWQDYTSVGLEPYQDGWLVRVRGTLAKLRADARGVVQVEVLPGPQALFAALRTGPGSVLLGTESGLCAYDLGTRVCDRLAPTGLNGSIRAIERDDRGRIWLLGDRLYRLESRSRAVAIPLTFLGDANRRYRAASMAISRNRIFIPLMGRGLLVVDADRAAALR
jgi:hypothetical protein